MKKLFLQVWIALCLVQQGICKEEGPLDFDVLSKDPAFWKSKPEEIIEKFPKNTLVFSPKTQTAYGRIRGTDIPGRLLGLTVYGGEMDFASNAVLRVSSSLIKSGKAGILINEDAENLIKNTLKDLDGWAGKKSARISGRSQDKNIRIQHHVWSKNNLGAIFTYALSEEKVEGKRGREVTKLILANVSLLAMSASPGQMNPRAILAQNDALSVSKIRPPTKNKEGDILLPPLQPARISSGASEATIGMVRAMRSVGVELAPLDVVQLDYPPGYPWRRYPDGPLNMARKAASSIGFRIKEEVNMDDKSFDRLRHEYNSQAKKSGSPVVDDILRDNIAGQLQLMDATLLKNIRGKRTSEVNAMRRTVQQSISKGVPLIWGMLDGKFSDPPVPGSEMSIMIITGLNTEKDEVIYFRPKDPEEKPHRMSFPDAWSVTMRLMTLMR